MIFLQRLPTRIADYTQYFRWESSKSASCNDITITLANCLRRGRNVFPAPIIHTHESSTHRFIHTERDAPGTFFPALFQRKILIDFSFIYKSRIQRYGGLSAGAIHGNRKFFLLYVLCARETDSLSRMKRTSVASTPFWRVLRREGIFYAFAISLCFSIGDLTSVDNPWYLFASRTS